jgi:hypothetical protein
MGIVQLTPGCPHLFLVAKFLRRGRATEFDEGRVCAVANVQ